ncbi:hypothetical protein [Actinomadura sp. NBRC 104412]|uniref:hypothetical protein n=1 Tax=Actinomadura sp. NBRC 104412 TaxID=3032203 RepID=UPI00255682AE|nr:hypothetical protein [Actinomadura sp. NBRC 104412]
MAAIPRVILFPGMIVFRMAASRPEKTGTLTPPPMIFMTSGEVRAPARNSPSQANQVDHTYFVG